MKKNVFLSVSSCLILLIASLGMAEKKAFDFYSSFEEVVKIVEDHFYDPVFIAKSFPAIEADYRKQLSLVSSRKTFADLVNKMLRELNASHTYYLTPEDCEYYLLGDLFSKIPEISNLFGGKEVRYPTVGILTQIFEDRVHVVSVLPGSIADKKGLLKGDEILSVNGNPYEPITSLRQSLGKDAVFKIRRKKTAEPFTIEMQPVLENPKQAFLTAQKSSIRNIEHAGKRIGYIHIYSYAGYDYHQELLNAITWGKLKGADALIIDLRYGLGGAAPSYLNIFNTNIPALKMYDNAGTETIFDSQWRKPAVYLVNRFSRSGKELLVFGARKYHMATVIGERTPGHVLGGRLFPLSSGDALFLAVQHCHIDGVDLEGVGVAPDIDVPFDVRYCAGEDAQLEKAISYLVDQLQGGDQPPDERMAD